MAGGSLENSLLHVIERQRLFPLLPQETGKVHHITGGGAKRDTPIRLNDKIELISSLKAEVISYGFGDGCLAFARQRDNHDHSFPYMTRITLA
jgi:hypothetical protein